MASLLTTRFVLLVIWCEIVRGKFVKIENLHLNEVNEDTKNNWDTGDVPLQLQKATMPSTNRTTMLRGYRFGGAGGSAAGDGAKLLQSVNELNLDGDLTVDGSSKKEWKSFYYPHQYSHTTGGTVLSNTGVPLGWSNGVINNNNLLSVGGYNPVTTSIPFDFGLKPGGVGMGMGLGGLGVGSTLQCLLFGVMGLVTFLLNSVMALLLSAKLPGLDGLLGPLLGGLGLGLGAFNKQDTVAADTKSKHMEYVHFPVDEPPGRHDNSPGQDRF